MNRSLRGYSGVLTAHVFCVIYCMSEWHRFSTTVNVITTLQVHPWKSLLRSGAIYQDCRTTIVFWSQPAASEHYYTCDALIHLALRSLRMIQASHPFCFLGCLSWRTEDICIDSGSPLVHLSASVQAWAMGPKLTRSRLPPPCAVDTPKGERKGEEVELHTDPKHKVHCWWGADSVRFAFLTCQKWNRAKILSWLTLPA